MSIRTLFFIGLCIFSILSAEKSYSQRIYFLDVEIIPTRPTKMDSVRIASSVNVDNSNDILNHSHLIPQSSDTIFVSTCYNAFGGTGQILYDTLNVGKLFDSVYHIKFSGYQTSGADCNSFFFSDDTVISFRMYPQPYVDSIEIQPGNPTEEDDIRIITHTSTTRPGKKLSFRHYYNMSSGDIYATGCYAITDSNVSDQAYTDTIHVGKLRNGVKNVHFKAYLSDDTSVCGNRVDSSMMSKSFTVQPAVSVEGVELNKILSIYPSPATNTIYIRKSRALELIEVEIKDLRGSTVLKPSRAGGIDISHLSKGLYIAHIITNKGATALKFVKE